MTDATTLGAVGTVGGVVDELGGSITAGRYQHTPNPNCQLLTLVELSLLSCRVERRKETAVVLVAWLLGCLVTLCFAARLVIVRMRARAPPSYVIAL